VIGGVVIDVYIVVVQGETVRPRTTIIGVEDIHRKSSLYLPCRFSQLSIEIPGDVPFPQDGPHKITQLSTKIEIFRDMRRRIPALRNLKVVKHGLRFDGFRRLFAGRSKRNVREEGAGLFSQG